MHLQHIPYVHYICKRYLTGIVNHLRSPLNDQKPLKMAISGASKVVYYTCKVSFTYIMHIWDMLKVHIEGKK
jgi:hypothetical protein